MLPEFLYRAFVEPVLHPLKAAEERSNQGFDRCAAMALMNLLVFVLVVTRKAWLMALYESFHLMTACLAARVAWDSEGEDHPPWVM